jgi:hypothetical protein
VHYSREGSVRPEPFFAPCHACQGNWQGQSAVKAMLERQDAEPLLALSHSTLERYLDGAVVGLGPAVRKEGALEPPVGETCEAFRQPQG